MSNLEEFQEFKFLAINTPKLWKDGNINEGSEGKIIFLEESDNEGYSKNGGIMLSSSTEYARSESFQLPITTTAIDLDLDLDCDIFYILDKETGKLAFYDFRSGYFEWIKCLRFKSPKCIRAGKENIYILDNDDLIVIAKTNFQVRRIFEFNSKNHLDIAVDTKEENIFILNSQEKQIYIASISSNTINTLLVDNESRNAISTASSIFIGRKDNKIYVLDSINKKIIMFPSIENDNEEEMADFNTIELEGDLGFVPSDVAVIDGENIFVADMGSGENYNPHPRKYTSSGSSEVLEYNRVSNKIILDRREQGPYVINYSDNVIIKFEVVNRYYSNGSYTTPRMDSGIQGLRWHKFVLNINIPDPVNTQIDVFYYASDLDLKNDPTDGQWIKTQFTNPKDSLIFDTIGRYLWMKFELFSHNSLSTPIVYGVRTYLPRLSYLRYLPKIYQENQQSKEFLERFLALFETFFVQIEEIGFTKYIDPRSCPDEFLPWLSSWLAIAYDENWKKKNFRKLIELAPQIYKMRGTRRGIETMLDLYLSGPEELDKDLSEIGGGGVDQTRFTIIENFQLDSVRDNDEYMRLFCNDPFTFCVIVLSDCVNETKKTIIKKIVDREKPAHTVGNVIFLEPWFYLGAHTYLGINTVLQESKFVLGDSAIGRDTILDRRESSGSVGSSRIDIDTHIF